MKFKHLALAISLLGLIACETTPAPALDTPQGRLSAVQKALEDISGLESASASLVEGKVKVDLVVSPTSAWDGDTYILTTAGTIERAFKSLGESKQLGNVWMGVVTLKAPLVDTYGNKSQTPVLRYAFRGEDLSKINWDEMVQQRLLEFTTPTWLHLEGAKMAKEYARDPSHADAAPTFCRIATLGH